MSARRVAGRALSLLAMGIVALQGASAVAHAEETTPDAIVDGLNSVFGKHAGKRAAHSKGVCVKGTFTPTAEAASLTRAAQFAKPVPLVGRFSLGGGNPAASDAQQDNARGLALHFDIGGGATTDLVMISAPVFVAKTPDDFLALLTAVASKDKDKIDAYFKAHPESTRQGAWLKERPVPASYASAGYFGVHAFTLTNAQGDKKVVKWEVVPKADEKGLTPDEAKAKGDDFYIAELKDRLAKGPVDYELKAVIGEAGDPEDDPTALWPDGRKSVAMGTISITGLEADATCDAGIFDPNNLTDGIDAPANDKILPMRSLDYAVSFGRRQTN